jgi:23S rRNA (cytosine1962-C5)-methyltransferase
MLTDHVEPIDRAFYQARIAAAEAYRRRVVNGSNAYRLVHAEADLLPGLIVDRYGSHFTVQTLDQGMDRAKADIIAALEELFAPRGIVERNDAAVRERENLPLLAGVVAGDVPDQVAVEMNGLTLYADLLRGQKTGIFLDQRENYVAAARYTKGRALDCFTSTGGFALHLAARCDVVEAVDSSGPNLEAARRNANANGIGNIEFREAGAFELLAGYAAARRRFDLVVLDPPAFAKSRAKLEPAARGYKEINRRALELLKSGGVLVTCSCSHHVSEAMLLEIVAEASLDTHRRLRVLERRTQAQDHPILLTVPETMYLKCLILEVL